MVIYDRSEPTDYRLIDQWENGLGWLAHPNETGHRASHLVDAPDGVWLIDPLDVPDLDDHIAEFGDLAGIAICSNYHARDADAIAARHGVSIFLPTWLRRPVERLSAPLERYESTLGDSGFEVMKYSPFPGYYEAIAYRESDGTLYVPDALGTAPFYTVGDERIACYGVVRLVPPRDLLRQIAPERILVGHGEGVFTDPAAALADALDGARRRLPTALRQHGLTQLQGITDAMRK